MPPVSRPEPDASDAPTLSIEDFAASIVASLSEAAPARDDDLGPETASPGAGLPFRERVKRRLGHADLLVFRVADELFAVELVAVEEALDLPEVHRLPEMPEAMIGVFTQRGALVSVFGPHASLGVRMHQPTTVVVFRGDAGERRIALATDDVDDVLAVDLRAVHDAPGAGAKDGSLLGVVHRGTELIALLDAETVVAAHRPLATGLPDTVKETA